MPVSDWISSYKVGKVESLKESGGKGTKALKICQVDVGDNGQTIPVVTVAPNVRLGSRLAVAPVGSTVLDASGEPMEVRKTTVGGGHVSEGIFCDSRMLAWEGGSVGIAVQMDDSLPLGSPPPGTKPRPKGDPTTTTELPESNVEGLFKKKLTKEEKKKIAEERKAARKAKKAAKEQEAAE
mmetsp:Transcript_19216/g.53530  ORF Transcript_19216/g.53530 Transcript_19216/m.53530 type:complete len:181 (-) Transcript_19216:318-860(-)|eukprot:CAMPEP_0172369506 /NCGR_PEP_ID=MMETSP1060-20121228/33228_1 /TAXON_ID=37318 /ORGANISM="Pseudo-nitzschia pungens, Strain cf. cingulata" /LENGTH=180 /DNA_ID=CAMNT_0013094451 /DNA_START=199 /DNA_END=741 /DNA_ORIENTATION=-